VLSSINPKVKTVEQGGQTFIQFNFDSELKRVATQRVTTRLLGTANIAGLPYENTDGSPLKIDTDYSGKPRNKTNPTPGPFERPGDGALRIRIW
jgi:alpha-N-arabinofuranosidase